MKFGRFLGVALLIIGLILALGWMAQDASAQDEGAPPIEVVPVDEGEPPPIEIVPEDGEPITIEITLPETIDEMVFIGLLALALVVIVGLGYLVRKELVKAHESIPIEALQILKAMGMEALEMAKDGAARTPNTIDDRLVGIIDGLIAARFNPIPGHIPPGPQPEPPPDPPLGNRQAPFLDQSLPYSER